VADSLSDARDALRRGETGEALVHLWNAYEEARGFGDRRAFGRIARVTREAASAGDEGERADAERLLRELGAGGEPEADFGVEDKWVPPGGQTTAPEPRPAPAHEPDFEPDEAEWQPEPGEEDAQPQRGRGIPIPFLIALAVFLFITIRNNFT
jgi:hypothetical protein